MTQIRVEVNIDTGGEPDIATSYSYNKVRTPAKPPETQLTFDAPIVETGGIPYSEATEAELDYAERLEQQAVQDEVSATTRRLYLRQLVKDVGKQRQMEGFAVNYQREPELRGAVEGKNHRKQQEGKVTLSRACGSCAMAAACPIKGDLVKWIAYHPYANSDEKLRYSSTLYPEVKVAEGRMKFLRRLSRNALAHCIPSQEA